MAYPSPLSGQVGVQALCSEHFNSWSRPLKAGALDLAAIIGLNSDRDAGRRPSGPCSSPESGGAASESCIPTTRGHASR